MSTVFVPHAADSAALVRHRMGAELRGGDLRVDIVDAAVLIVSELMGNAVRHGSALPGGGLLARWEVVGDALRVEVVDGGSGPGDRPVGVAPDAEGGRGLELVDALASRWGSAPAAPGTAVWAELPAVIQLPA